jgi:acyl-CoA thioesterase-2
VTGGVIPPTDLATALEIETLDRDLYRGVRLIGGPDRRTLFGGQVAAHALRAAGLTVPDGRLPHTIYGYFLRSGRAELPVILRVDRDRDGRSLSARRVVAVQQGEVIFSMLASFAAEESSAEFAAPATHGVEPPEGLGPSDHHLMLEIRGVRPTGVEIDDAFHPTQMWVRVPDPLPEDPLVQACALAYISDLGTGFGQVQLPGLARGGPSIDHAVWFQRLVRFDDWVLVDLWPGKAQGRRGLYHGAIRDRAGALAAMLSQEMLLRPAGG